MPTLPVGPDSDLELQEIADIMGKSRKVVVVTGAGISTNCGIPDFRSENGLYSLIQAQYDAAVKNPPWEQSNLFDIDDRPKKKRKQWYYEVVAPDGKVVDVIDEDIAPLQDSQNGADTQSQPDSQTPRHSIRSRSSNTTTSNSRASTPSVKSSSGSSLSSCSSLTPEVPISFSEIANESQQSASSLPTSPTTPIPTDPIDLSNTPFVMCNSSSIMSESSSQDSSKEVSPQPQPSQPQSSSNQRQSLPNLKGRDLFDSMVWQDAFTTSIFYMFVSSLRQKVKSVASTSQSHKFLRVLRDGGRLVRNYSQNVDMLEEREGLCTDLLQGVGSRSRFSAKRILGQPARDTGSGVGGCESVSLHGTLGRLRCSLCNTFSDWDAEGRIGATLAGTAPDCPTCTTYSERRTGNGRRRLAVGRLRPDIVLYGEEHPNSNLIAPLITHDLALGPDVLLIMGTSLRVHGLKVMVKEFAKAVHTRGGKVVFVNRTKPSESTWGDVIDYWVEWDCDEWVMDLKDRREDIWEPLGAAAEDRRDSIGGATNLPKKRPQCKRDDKTNGVYVTFKIMDQLGKLKDGEGRLAERFQYWAAPSRVLAPSRVSTVVKTEPKKQPAKKVMKGAAAKRSTKPATKKQKLKEPTPEPEDPKEMNNQAYIVAKHWQHLRTLAPGLTPAPEYLRTPLKHFKGNEGVDYRPDYLKPFAFHSSSNHLPNIGSASDWPLSKLNLVSHPPSGSTIPVHTPKPEERKVPERKINHSYGTRASKRFSNADTIVVDGGEVEDVAVGDENVVDENEHTIVVDDPIVTPSSDRIKRSCSIGAIVSSPEDGEMWHDAKEVL